MIGSEITSIVAHFTQTASIIFSLYHNSNEKGEGLPWRQLL